MVSSSLNIKHYNQVKIILIPFAFLCLLCGCMKTTEKTCKAILSTDIPSGIFYEDHIYWEVKTISNDPKAKVIGTVKASTDCQDFPQESYNVTQSANKYIGQPVYQNGSILYIPYENQYHMFIYISKMDLGSSIALSPSDDDASYPLHFVYHGMRYFVNGNIPELDNIPKGFQEVGTIKKTLYYASENFTGNVDQDSAIYEHPSQNRYMLLRMNEVISVFENEAYMNYE